MCTTILPPLSNSDHNVTRFSLIVEERLSEDKVRIVDYNKADREGIRDVLGRVEWDDSLTDNTTTEENLFFFCYCAGQRFIAALSHTSWIHSPPSLKALARAFLQERKREGGEVYG